MRKNARKRLHREIANYLSTVAVFEAHGCILKWEVFNNG